MSTIAAEEGMTTVVRRVVRKAVKPREVPGANTDAE